MPLLLQKLLFSASIWLIAGLFGAWKYRRQPRGAYYILRGVSVFAAITGVIGLILPRFCWPWVHICAPTLIFLVILTLIYVRTHPDENDRPKF